MAITQVYVDPAINANSGTGTIGDPYGDLQYALNTQVRDAVNGDQFNIKAGTAEILARSTDLSTYGTPTESAPLTFRGYTTAANDGGKGIVNCNAVGIFGSAAEYISIIDMIGYNSANNTSIFQTGPYSLVYRCEAYGGVGAVSSGINVRTASLVVGCYVHDTAGFGINTGYGATFILGNYLSACAGSRAISLANISDVAIGNLVRGVPNGGTGINFYNADRVTILGNAVVGAANSTGTGIVGSTQTKYTCAAVMNNIVSGFNGVGGTGISIPGRAFIVGYNAIYNCTIPEALGVMLVDLTANDVALAADPFVDAANGNFALTDAAKLLLRSAGWPSSYLGASTDPHITIGAVQYGAAEAGGGGVIRRAMRMIGG